MIYFVLAFLFFLLFALMYIPGLQITLAKSEWNFCLMYLNALDWLVCILIAMICTISFEVVKYFSREKGIVF